MAILRNSTRLTKLYDWPVRNALALDENPTTVARSLSAGCKNAREYQPVSLRAVPSRKGSLFRLAKKRDIMRWFGRKKKSKPFDEPQACQDAPLFTSPPVSARTVELIARLPASILENIFAFVCPHALDETYDSSEQSGVEYGCMLCALRDLAHCAQVSKKWRSAATNVM